MPRILDPVPALRVRAIAPDGAVRALALPRAGRWAIVAFYPRDFTAVCPTELRELSKRAREFRDLGADVVALSVDDLDTHRRWIEQVLGPLEIPLASDPAGDNARAWGAFLEREGVAARATFVVDPAGVLRHASFYDPSIGRSVSETLRVLEALGTGDLSPAEWRRGDPTLGR